MSLFPASPGARQDFSTKFEGVARRDARTAAGGPLDDHDAARQGRHDTIACWEAPWAGGHAPGELRHEEALTRHVLAKAGVRMRIDHVRTAAQDRDRGRPLGVGRRADRRCLRRRVDAQRETADHKDASTGEIAAQGRGHLDAVGRWPPRAHDRHRRASAQTVESPWSISGRSHRARTKNADGNSPADAGAKGLERIAPRDHRWRSGNRSCCRARSSRTSFASAAANRASLNGPLRDMAARRRPWAASRRRGWHGPCRSFAPRRTSRQALPDQPETRRVLLLTLPHSRTSLLTRPLRQEASVPSQMHTARRLAGEPCPLRRRAGLGDRTPDDFGRRFSAWAGRQIKAHGGSGRDRRCSRRRAPR